MYRNNSNWEGRRGWFIRLLVVGIVFGVVSTAEARPSKCRTQHIRELRFDGELERAQTVALDCLQEYPGAVGLRIEYVRVIGARGRFSTALEQVETLIEEHPDHVGLRVLQIRLLKRRGNIERALVAIDEYPDRLDKPPTVLELAGTLRVWQGQYIEAIDVFDTYLAREDGTARVYYYRGIAHQNLGRYGRARRDFRRACEMEPEATNACSALDDFETRGANEVFGYVQPGYSWVHGDLDGWSVETAVGARLDEGWTFQAGMEMRARGLGEQPRRDLIAEAQARRAFLDGWQFTGGGAVGIDPDFTPAWNAFAEASHLFDGGIEPALRLWRIQFADTGVTVLIPKGTWYTESLRVDARSYLTLSDAREFSYSGVLKASYYFAYPSAISLGVGGGNRSDFLEVRRSDTEQHLVALAGVSWNVSNRSRLGFDVVYRTESVDTRRFHRTQFFVKYEYRSPFSTSR